MRYLKLDDTWYEWFAVNDTSGSGDDGASVTFAVREAGAADDDPPIVTGNATLLTDSAFPAGCYECEILASEGNGFSADKVYGMFSTAAVSGQNPTGFIGNMQLAPVQSILADGVDHGGVPGESTARIGLAELVIQSTKNGGAILKVHNTGSGNAAEIITDGGAGTAGLYVEAAAGIFIYSSNPENYTSYIGALVLESDNGPVVNILNDTSGDEIAICADAGDGVVAITGMGSGKHGIVSIGGEGGYGLLASLAPETLASFFETDSGKTFLDAVAGSVVKEIVENAGGGGGGGALPADGLDSIAIEDGVNARQAISLLLASAAGKLTGVGTSTYTFFAKNDTDDPRIVATVDTTGRTSVTWMPPA